MTEQPPDEVSGRSDDDSDVGWGEDAASADELRRRMEWYARERPPHASE
jgi:hypothetical protein